MLSYFRNTFSSPFGFTTVGGFVFITLLLGSSQYINPQITIGILSKSSDLYMSIFHDVIHMKRLLVVDKKRIQMLIVGECVKV